MTMRNHLDVPGWLKLARACAVVGLAVGPAACASDGGGDDDSTLSINGFALTEDDQSDDGFTDGADTGALEDEVADDLDDGESEAPPADEADPEGAPQEGVDRVGRTVLITWGQPELNPAMQGTPTVWSGRIWSDVAAVHALRVVRFERAAQHDHLVRDEDPKTVSFETTTTTDHDGVLVRVVGPRDAATLDGELAFESEHFTKTIPLRDLFGGAQLSFVADDLGNELHVVAGLPHRCAHGLVRLGWERKGPRGGVFGGKIYGDDGAPSGHVVGLWGTVGGKQRLKGVYRAEDGTYLGTVRGAWTPLPGDVGGRHGGTFRGVWTREGQVKGVFGGLFRVGDERGEGSGMGFWRASCGDGAGGADACAADLALPAPDPAACECGADGENAIDACACDVPPADTCVAPEE